MNQPAPPKKGHPALLPANMGVAMPRVDAITLKVGKGTTAPADVVIDGVEHRDLIVRRHRSRVYVAGG